MESTNFNFNADMDFSGFNMTQQQVYSKPEEDNTSAFFFGDEGIDTVGSFGQQYDSMNPTLFPTDPQESSFGLQQQLTMDNTVATASAWNGQLTPEQHALNSFPPTPVQSFDSLCQPTYNTILGKRSLQLDVPEYPQSNKRHETFSPFTPSTTSWQLESTPSMASGEIGLSEEAADVCATWFNKYAMLPSDRHIESLSQLTGESSKAIRHWFGRLLKQGMGSHDSAYKSQTGFSQSEQLWGDISQQTTSDLTFNDFPTTTLSESSCNHETANNQPSPPLRGGKKGCTPTDDPELLRRDSNKIYQCTRKCGKRYGRKCDWKRNEEEGYPSKSWMCSLCTTQGVEKVKPCFRKYHFSQHFRNIHPGVNCEEYEESSIVYSETDFPRKCGFCRHRFVSRQDRIDHIADHFKQGKCMLDWNDDDDENSHDSDNADDDDSPSGDGFDGNEPFDPSAGDDSHGGYNSKNIGGGSSGGSGGNNGFDSQPPHSGFFEFQLSQLKSNAPGDQCSSDKQRIEPGAGRNTELGTGCNNDPGTGRNRESGAGFKARPGTENQSETCASIRTGPEQQIKSSLYGGTNSQPQSSPTANMGEQESIHDPNADRDCIPGGQEAGNQRSMHGQHDSSKTDNQQAVARNVVSRPLLGKSTATQPSQAEHLATIKDQLKQGLTRTIWWEGLFGARNSGLDNEWPGFSKLTRSHQQNQEDQESVESIPKPPPNTDDSGSEKLVGMSLSAEDIVTRVPALRYLDPSLTQELSGLVDRLSSTIAAQIATSTLLPQQDPPQEGAPSQVEIDNHLRDSNKPAPERADQHTKINEDASNSNSDVFSPSSFISLRLLGTGGFGTVDEVIHRQTNLRLARKTLKNRDPSALQELKKEVNMLQKLRHPHVVRLVGSYSKDNRMSLLISPVADTTLALWLDKFVLQKPANLSETIMKMFGCLLSSVRYLHEQRPVVKHMDIKPQNILVMHADQELPHIVLCDFGVSSSSDDMYDPSPRPLTRHYIAPEVLDGKKREQASDIWSLGCVLFEMASVPFSQENSDWERLRKEYTVRTGKDYWQDVTGLQDQLSGILNQAKTRTESTVVQAVQSMLQASPAERPSATALTMIFTPAPCCLNWPNDAVTFPGPNEELKTVETLLRNTGNDCYTQIHPRCRPKDNQDSEPLDQIMSWLNECSHQHEACQRPASDKSTLPTRLIDIQPEGADSRFVRVIGSDEIGSSCTQVEYIAVCHTWKHEELTLTSDRLQSMKNELPRENLPKAINDAALAAQRMGHRYIWADSLCILQDSEDDKRKECTSMATIFRNAVLTIVPHALEVKSSANHPLTDKASSSGDGIQPYAFVPVSDNRKRTVTGSTSSQSVLPTVDFNTSGFAWDTRAWSLQERLLSRRYVHLGEGQVYWECNALKASETFPMGLQSSLLWEKAHLKMPFANVLPQSHAADSAADLKGNPATIDNVKTKETTYDRGNLLHHVHNQAEEPEAQFEDAPKPSMRKATRLYRYVDSKVPSAASVYKLPLTDPTRLKRTLTIAAHVKRTLTKATRLRDCQWIRKEGDGIGDSMEAARQVLEFSNQNQGSPLSAAPSPSVTLSSSSAPLERPSNPSTESSSEPARKRARLEPALPPHATVTSFTARPTKANLRRLWSQFAVEVEQCSTKKALSPSCDSSSTGAQTEPGTNFMTTTTQLPLAIPVEAANHDFANQDAGRKGQDDQDITMTDNSNPQDSSTANTAFAVAGGIAATQPPPSTTTLTDSSGSNSCSSSSTNKQANPARRPNHPFDFTFLNVLN